MLMKSRMSNEVVLFQNAQIADLNHIFNRGHVDAQLHYNFARNDITESQAFAM